MALMGQWISSWSTFSKSTHMNALPETAAIPLGLVNNSSSMHPNAELDITVNLSTVAGTFEFYLLTSPTTNDFTDNIDPDSTADQSGSIYQARRIASFVVDSTQATLYWHCNDVSAMIDQNGNRIGNLSKYWTLLPKNVTDAALPSTDHTVKYAHKTLEST